MAASHELGAARRRQPAMNMVREGKEEGAVSVAEKEET
jgi:hypothetical protein